MATILIVDDSPTDTRVFSTVLERNGFTVITADNAEDGVAKARDEQPDLVLMDVILPGMNGFQATRALARDPATQHIPVIIVSTKNMETDRVWGLRQGAKDYLVKPPSEKELVHRIRALLPEGVE
ncbi:MAG: response regulator [Lysobacteraceae bacterium]|nr:MAG: response regulator [Xanthomonadaceae bacterium]